MGFSGKGILVLEIVAIVGGLGGRIVRRSRMLMLFDLGKVLQRPLEENTHGGHEFCLGK